MERRDTVLEQQLSHALDGLRLGTPCYAFQELPSTMDLAHQLASQGASEGTCVWAERQTAGRGRAGRSWASPPGGMYLSLLLRPSRNLDELAQLALVVGLATVQAIHELTKLSPTIRWPNDVLLNDRKVAGILVEAKSHASSEKKIGDVSNFQYGGQKIETSRILSYAVVGIGINVTTATHELPEGATSLYPWVNPAPDRFALTTALFQHLKQVYQQWNDRGFGLIRPVLLRWIGMFGQLVHLITARETFDGQALDLDDSGRLLVRLDSGIVRAFEAGEVTLFR